MAIEVAKAATQLFLHGDSQRTEIDDVINSI